jgi:iron complex transport system substrate-binding protein
MFLFGMADSLMLMNEDTYAGSVAKDLGAVNILNGTDNATETYVPYNMEAVVAANPDMILLVAHGDADAVKAQLEQDMKDSDVWEKLTAAQNGKMMALNYDVFGTASLNTAGQAYLDMFDALYGAATQ